MEGETSWISHCTDNLTSCTIEFDTFSDLTDESNKETSSPSMDLVLPDDLLERILSYLPIASIFRAGSVCKRWHEIVSSKRFLWNHNNNNNNNNNNSHLKSSHKPWYFMFTSSDEPTGYAFDPILKKWYGLDLPCIQTSNWSNASSCGLVCFMDNDSRSQLYICNPITKSWRALCEPTGGRFPDYSALALSVDRGTHVYNISVVKSKQVPGNYFQWEISIHLYDSEMGDWSTALNEVLTGWRAGDQSVICDGILYFLIYSTGGGGGAEGRHGLIRYNLGSGSDLMRSFIPVPCSLTCGRLMNLNGKLVMVGGIGKVDRPDIIKGIGIWGLRNGREWEDMGRMPHKLFQSFGEFDDVFASSGTDDLIYIQSYGAPLLLVFDIGSKQWKWSQKCPVTKRFPLQLFNGFCFEPRLEIAP